MNPTRFGVIGLGNMGMAHAKSIAGDSTGIMQLAGVADVAPGRAAAVGAELNCPGFASAESLLDSGLVDAVVVATVHYWHPVHVIMAARRGIHVLCEKPVAVTVGDARAMIRECEAHRVTLAVMFQHRNRPIYHKIKSLLDEGRLGDVFRVRMVCSAWFRNQRYYDNGSWRGTWDGEGGGVLMNQSPHHLDLFCWLVGMPSSVSAVVETRAHQIEVEDTAHILCSWGSRRSGYIYATTAEEPGEELIELAGDKGVLRFADGVLSMGELPIPISRRLAEAEPTNVFDPNVFQKLQWKPIEVAPGWASHHQVTQDFVRSLRGETANIVTGRDGSAGLELANAAYLAGYEGRPVKLPVDAPAMEQLLDRLISERSTGRGAGIRSQARAELAKLLA